MVDLGLSPLCQSLVPPDRIERMEPSIRSTSSSAPNAGWRSCRGRRRDEIFVEYGYFSAYSDSWVEHSRGYVEMITPARARRDDLVVEIGANDGYLLQHFVHGGVPVLGIDPAANVAEAAARGASRC